jgi:hypothetical protein
MLYRENSGNPDVNDSLLFTPNTKDVPVKV